MLEDTGINLDNLVQSPEALRQIVALDRGEYSPHTGLPKILDHNRKDIHEPDCDASAPLRVPVLASPSAGLESDQRDQITTAYWGDGTDGPPVPDGAGVVVDLNSEAKVMIYSDILGPDGEQASPQDYDFEPAGNTCNVCHGRKVSPLSPAQEDPFDEVPDVNIVQCMSCAGTGVEKIPFTEVLGTGR